MPITNECAGCGVATIDYDSDITKVFCADCYASRAGDPENQAKSKFGVIVKANTENKNTTENSSSNSQATNNKSAPSGPVPDRRAAIAATKARRSKSVT